MPKVVTHNGQLVTLNGKALEIEATDLPNGGTEKRMD